VRFRYATQASQGARNYQEDAASVVEGAGGLTAVLADGMGGHAGGALASNLACKFFLHAFATAQGTAPEKLAESLELANAAIAHEVHNTPSLNGMGCTLIGAVFGGDGVEWVSVGDSPLFLVREGEIAVLNEDHSLAPEIDKLAAMGRISWEAARNDHRRHFLRSALTGGEIEMIDRSHRPLALQSGDAVVLASDGIHTISHAVIAKVVSANGEPAAAAIALLDAVQAVGDTAQDNTTVVVVRVDA
jgi:serine/threonine protein phosphatase PrpC